MTQSSPTWIFKKNVESRSMRPYLTGLGMPGFVAGTEIYGEKENMRMAWGLGVGLSLEAFLNLFHYARVTLIGQVPLCWSWISDKSV